MMRSSQQQGQLSNPRPTLVGLSACVALGLVILVIAFGPIILFPRLPLSIPLPSAYLLALSAILGLVSFFRRSLLPTRTSLAYAGLILLAIYYSSNLPFRPHSFTQTPSPTLTLLFLFFISLPILALLKQRVFVALLVLGVFAALLGMLSTTSGGLIFSDDHPCFLYRLIQLKENFPNIPFYNPLWNAGVEAREFFASGVLNVFLLFSPVLYLLDITHSYTYLVYLLLFVVVPGAAFLAAKIGGYSAATGAVAGILTMSCSHFWYRWTLSYGTLGFALSAALVPLNLVLLTRIVERDSEFKFIHALVFCCSLSLMLLWSPSALMIAPLLLYSLFRIRTALAKRWTIFAFLLLLAINLPWMGIFYKVSNVGDFVAVSPENPALIESKQGASDAPAHALSKFKIANPAIENLPWWKQVLKSLRDNAIPVNPLVLFFGLAGLCALQSKQQKLIFSLAVLCALGLGTLGPLIKPQLELERMLIVLSLILSFPAAILVSDFLAPLNEGLVRKHIMRAPLLAFLCFAPLWIWRVSSNATSETYHSASPLVSELTQFIVNHPTQDRILFAGFSLHELSGGHLAPLAAWTKKPLIASSYQHDKWRYTDVIPEEFRKRKEQGVLEYLDLMNVSLIITHDRFWRGWFAARPHLFEKVWGSGKFRVFQRIGHHSNYFLEGAGVIIRQDGNQVSLELESSEAVIKFSYLPFLESADCTLAPFRISPGIVFTRLSNCPKSKPISIKAAPIFDRML